MEETATKPTEWINARIVSVDNWLAGTPYGWCVYDKGGSREYSADEYTMKVVFEKKRKPLRVGDHVFCMGVRGVIDAIATSNGPVRECWVRDEDTGQHTTISEVILSRVGEI